MRASRGLYGWKAHSKNWEIYKKSSENYLQQIPFHKFLCIYSWIKITYNLIPYYRQIHRNFHVQVKINLIKFNSRTVATWFLIIPSISWEKTPEVLDQKTKTISTKLWLPLFLPKFIFVGNYALQWPSIWPFRWLPFWIFSCKQWWPLCFIMFIKKSWVVHYFSMTVFSLWSSIFSVLGTT